MDWSAKRENGELRVYFPNGEIRIPHYYSSRKWTHVIVGTHHADGLTYYGTRAANPERVAANDRSSGRMPDARAIEIQE